MARYVVDAPTVLHLVDHGLAVHPGVQLKMRLLDGR